MSGHDATHESEAGTQSEFGRSTRRAFLSRLGMAGLFTSIANVFAQKSSTALAKTAAPAPEGAIPVALKVNGKKYDLRIDPRTTLLDCLREHLHLTGSKKGCDHG